MRPPFDTMRKLEIHRSKWGTPYPRTIFRNPLPPERPPASQLQRRVEQKRIELDDAEYFNYEAGVIAELRQQLAVLEAQLAEAEGSVDPWAQGALLADRRAQERAEWARRQMQRNPYYPVRENPLLAVVGMNPPPGREVHPLAFVARDRYRADLEEPGHQEAAEYWRGQAGAFFTMNPRAQALEHHCRSAHGLAHRAREDEDFQALHHAHEHLKAAHACCPNPPGSEERGILDAVLAEIDVAEEELFAGLKTTAGKVRKAVAGSGKGGRVKGRGKRQTKKNFKVGAAKKPKKKRFSLEEAKKRFKDFDGALRAYRRFHDRDPDHVDLYEFDDGEPGVREDPVQVALHRTLETNYIVPDGWDSNKNGALYKHEHIEGALNGDVDIDARIEELPLEVYDRRTNTTRKFGGNFYITDWWREKGQRQREH